MADMKRYIISFQATLQGHKMVLSAMKGMEKQMVGVTKVTQKSGKAAKTYSEQLAALVKRAAMVIPVWLVLRATMMMVMRTFGDMVRGFIDLDDQLARIRTVMHGTTKVIDTQMMVIRSRILDVAKDSRIPIKELAEGFYFLKTANLDATEATAAFDHVTNLAIGTANSMAESARAVAGIYNTMGKYLGDNLTVHEKFQKIADVLAYTYSTQDVQLSELIQSYTKLAPYVTGLSDNFTELTTMLGFLNTRLLRGGRTGRLTGRAILQLTKNAKKLALQLGITFPPDKPIAFLDTIRMIRDELGIVGKITAAQGQIIQDVFATRAGVTIRLLIEHFDELEEQIQDAIKGAGGFAQKMKEIRMGTIAGQMARMKNILVILTTEFLTATYGTENLADSLKLMNNSLLSMRDGIREVGTLLGWLTTQMSNLQVAMELEAPSGWISAIPGGEAAYRLSKFRKQLEAFRTVEFTSLEDYRKKVQAMYNEEEARLNRIKEIEKEIISLRGKRIEVAQKEERGLESEEAIKIEEKIKKLREEKLELSSDEIKLQHEQNKLKAVENKLEDKGLSYLDKAIEKEKARIRMMKIMGASTLDIAKVELEIAEGAQLEIEPRKEQLELLKAQYKVTEETVKYRKQITDVLLKAEIDLARVAGASESQVLEIIEDQLEARKDNISQDKYQLQLIDLRIKQQAVLLREKAKEVQVAKNLAVAYEKADMFQKGRIRRAIELMQLTDEELAARYRNDAYDREVMLDYWSSFRKSAQDAILEAIWQMRGFPGEAPKIEAKDLLPEDAIITYAQKYREEMFKAVDDINARFQAGMPTFGGRGVPPTAPVGAGAPTGAGAGLPITKPGIIPSPIIQPTPAYKPAIRQRGGRTFGGATVEEVEKIMRNAFREEMERNIQQQMEEGEKNRDKLEAVIDRVEKNVDATRRGLGVA